MSDMTIGQLANRADVNIQTVRYYERRGLLSAYRRSDAGYRFYTESAVARIRFIKQAKRLGFTLDEIQVLLALRIETTDTCDEVRKHAEQKVQEIAEKLRMLQRIKATLTQLIVACEQRQTTSACPLLAALDREGNDQQ